MSTDLWCHHGMPRSACAICSPKKSAEDSWTRHGLDGAADLPHWCRAVRYRADDDIITLVVHIPTSNGSVAEVNLEAMPDDAQKLVDAITQAVERSKRVASTIDLAD